MTTINEKLSSDMPQAQSTRPDPSPCTGSEVESKTTEVSSRMLRYTTLYTPQVIARINEIRRKRVGLGFNEELMRLDTKERIALEQEMLERKKANSADG